MEATTCGRRKTTKESSIFISQALTPNLCVDTWGGGRLPQITGIKGLGNGTGHHKNLENPIKTQGFIHYIQIIGIQGIELGPNYT